MMMRIIMRMRVRRMMMVPLSRKLCTSFLQGHCRARMVVSQHVSTTGLATAVISGGSQNEGLTKSSGKCESLTTFRHLNRPDGSKAYLISPGVASPSLPPKRKGFMQQAAQLPLWWWIPVKTVHIHALDNIQYPIEDLKSTKKGILAKNHSSFYPRPPLLHNVAAKFPNVSFQVSDEAILVQLWSTWDNS